MKIRWDIQRPNVLTLFVALVTMLLALAALPRVLDRLNPPTGDEPFYLMTAGALWDNHTFDEARQWQTEAWRRFYPPEPQPADFRGWPSYPVPLPPHASETVRPSGEQYSKHGPGVPLLIAPAYGLFGRPGALALYAALAGLLASQIFLLAWEAGGSRGTALLIWAALSLSSPLFSYALAIFPALPAALLTVFAYRGLRRWPQAGPLRRVLTGAALGFLPWLHTLFVLLSLPFAARLLLADAKERCWARLAAWLAPLALGGGGLLTYHFFLYGGPWPNFQDHAGFN
ncbi:MAG: hypothetical protein NTZ05_00975, partial [Chloroflexi bacterium]|nr:hypothetical protein [Chloroflexota bacterium]